MSIRIWSRHISPDKQSPPHAPLRMRIAPGRARAAPYVHCRCEHVCHLLERKGVFFGIFYQLLVSRLEWLRRQKTRIGLMSVNKILKFEKKVFSYDKNRKKLKSSSWPKNNPMERVWHFCHEVPLPRLWRHCLLLLRHQHRSAPVQVSFDLFFY